VDVKPLGIVHAKNSQVLKHGFVLDKLGDRLQAHHLGHVDEATHRGRVQRVGQYIAHKLTVDLQEIER